MEGTGNYDRSRATSMEQTSHQTSQEWIVQLLPSPVPLVPHPVKRCMLASSDLNCLFFVILSQTADSYPRAT
jgi:hypothetical protein